MSKQYKCNKCYDNGVVEYFAGGSCWTEDCECKTGPFEKDYRELWSAVNTTNLEVSEIKIENGDWVYSDSDRSFKHLRDLLLHVHRTVEKKRYSMSTELEGRWKKNEIECVVSNDGVSPLVNAHNDLIRKHELLANEYHELEKQIFYLT